MVGGENKPAPRRRWMLYPVYVAAVLVFVGMTVFLATLNQTREFIGEWGSEYCWMYGSFERYVFTHLVLICVDIAVLLALYWLARRDLPIAYLVVWAAWLLSEPLLSFFDMSYC
jgi:hypothetical protein